MHVRTFRYFEKSTHVSLKTEAVHVKYKWELPNTRPTCACASPYYVAHALSCPKGGFIITGHNSSHNMSAKLLNEVCQEVQVNIGV